MAQGLGRLRFAALALEWKKPFFGPALLLIVSHTRKDRGDEVAVVLFRNYRKLGLLGFVKNNAKRVIAALELLATLIAVKLWVSNSNSRQLSIVSMKGFTDNKSNESLVRKGLQTKSLTCSTEHLEGEDTKGLCGSQACGKQKGKKATTLVAGTSSKGRPGGRRSSPATTGIPAIP